jgi:predicted transcriptional regulator
MPRPKTGETPIRHVRVPDVLWEQVGEIAREQGRTVTAVVLEALEKHVQRHRRKARREDR